MNATGAGRQGVERVLAGDFLDGLRERPLEKVRERRREAEQEEVDLSYLRRLLQGRLDIVSAELARRAGGPEPTGTAGDGGLVERLPEILADRGRSSHGSGRFLTVEPSAVDERRSQVEQAAPDPSAGDLGARADDELRAAHARLREMEEEVSRDRRQVQQVMDACTAEIGRRYKEGAARVDDLLTGP
ncbi:MAG: hypothetical protein M3P96_00985 [Actinomycetota bacterium]|nr:hypothetical protein [Actinomycetota bacterium]